MLVPLFHPLLIVPGILQIPDDRRGLGRDFIKKGKGIGFIDFVIAGSRANMQFVECALSDAGEKAFPNTRFPYRGQGVCSVLPIIERPDD
jgi:hypothetical protein